MERIKRNNLRLIVFCFSLILACMVFLGMFAACNPTALSQDPAVHTCESVCETCGKCTDVECMETVCAEKCQCHTIPPTMTGITISEAKTEFNWGDEFSVGNASVKANYSNGSEKVLSETDYTVDASAFNNTQAGTYSIKIQYDGKQVAYDVTVKAPHVVSLNLNSYKSEFAYNETFTFGGSVEAVYVDGDEKLLSDTEYEINNMLFNSRISGEYNIIVSLKGSSVTATYTVFVKPANIVSISLSSYKTKYVVGTSLDFSTINVTATRANGDTVALTADDITIDSGSCDGKTVGTYEIKVYYKEEMSIYTTFTIHVTDKFIRVLMIGNSFSDDTSDLAPYILDELGYVYEIGNMYVGGCSIDMHYSYATQNKNIYYFRYYENGAWTSMYTGKHVTLEYGIKFKDWDIITFQQVSGASGVPDTYSNFENLMSYVKERATNKDVRFMFNMTWAYAKSSTHSDFPNYNNNQMTMYNAIVSTVQSVVIGQYNLPVIPCGTAVQNARTSSVLSESMITRDGYHLTMDSNGRYIAALTFVSFITGEDISNIQYTPKNVNTSKKKAVAIESAKNALANPFVITQSAY